MGGRIDGWVGGEWVDGEGVSREFWDGSGVFFISFFFVEFLVFFSVLGRVGLFFF